jgi:hypothetical protein
MLHKAIQKKRRIFENFLFNVTRHEKRIFILENFFRTGLKKVKGGEVFVF